MSYSTCAWIASFLYAVAAIAGKLTSKHAVANPWLFNFVWYFFTLILTIPFAISNGAAAIPSQWLEVTLAALFYALTGIGFALALYRIDLSVLSPLFNLRTAFSVVLGGFFLNEILTVQQYTLIALLVFAGVFVSYDQKLKLRAFFQPGIGIAVVNMLFLALLAIFMNRAVAVIGFWQATLWSQLLGQIMLLLTIPCFMKDLFAITKKQIAILAFISIAEFGGTLAANKAYAGNVSISSAIISVPFSMIVACIFSTFWPELLENHPAKVYLIRFTAAAVMIGAALAL